MAERLPFADFLDLLRAEGLQVGLGDYQALGLLLARIKTARTQTLSSAIAALMARNEAEAERIKELFQSYCGTEESAAADRSAVTPVRLSAPPTQPMLPPGSRLGRLVLLSIALVAIVSSLLVLRARLGPDGSPRQDAGDLAAQPGEPTRPDLAAGNSPAQGNAPEGAEVAAPQTQALQTVMPSAADGGAVEVAPAAQDGATTWRQRRLHIGSQSALGGMILFLGLGLSQLWTVFLRRKRRQLSSYRGPAYYSLQLRDLRAPLTREDLDHLATVFDRLRFSAGPGRNIDVRRSLLRRLRAELPPLVFAQHRQRCALLVLRELSPASRATARLIDTFVTGMQARGLVIRCYYFRGSPEWVAKKPDGPPLPLAELLPLVDESVLCVFSSSAALRQRPASANTALLQTLTQFPRSVWLLSDLDQLMDPMVLHGLPIPQFPQSYRGLMQAARALLQGTERSIAPRWPLPSQRMSDATVSKLQQLVQLAPLATPELAELLRQRYAPEIPEQALPPLIARSLDPSGETLVFATSPDGASNHVAVPPADPLRSALVRRYLLQVLGDSEPRERRSLAYLRWRLDRALLTLQIPDPRQVLHPPARIELLALLKTPLAEEVLSTADQRAVPLPASAVTAVLSGSVRAPSAVPWPQELLRRSAQAAVVRPPGAKQQPPYVVPTLAVLTAGVWLFWIFRILFPPTLPKGMAEAAIITELQRAEESLRSAMEAFNLREWTKAKERAEAALEVDPANLEAIQLRARSVHAVDDETKFKQGITELDRATPDGFNAAVSIFDSMSPDSAYRQEFADKLRGKLVPVGEEYYAKRMYREAAETLCSAYRVAPANQKPSAGTIKLLHDAERKAGMTVSCNLR